MRGPLVRLLKNRRSVINTNSLLVIAMLSTSGIVLAAPGVAGQITQGAAAPVAAVKSAAQAPAIVQEKASEAAKSTVTEQLKAAVPEPAKQGLKTAGSLKEKLEKAPTSVHEATTALKDKAKQEAVSKAVGAIH